MSWEFYIGVQGVPRRVAQRGGGWVQRAQMRFPSARGVAAPTVAPLVASTLHIILFPFVSNRSVARAPRASNNAGRRRNHPGEKTEVGVEGATAAVDSHFSVCFFFFVCLSFR